MADATRAWVTDDDETIRYVLERALSRAGYQVQTFATVAGLQDALEALHRTSSSPISACPMPMGSRCLIPCASSSARSR